MKLVGLYDVILYVDKIVQNVDKELNRHNARQARLRLDAQTERIFFCTAFCLEQFTLSILRSFFLNVHAGWGFELCIFIVNTVVNAKMCEDEVNVALSFYTEALA